MPVRNYQELIVWQKAMDFAEQVYRRRQMFPSQGIMPTSQYSARRFRPVKHCGRTCNNDRVFLRHSKHRPCVSGNSVLIGVRLDIEPKASAGAMN